MKIKKFVSMAIIVLVITFSTMGAINSIVEDNTKTIQYISKNNTERLRNIDRDKYEVKKENGQIILVEK